MVAETFVDRLRAARRLRGLRAVGVDRLAGLSEGHTALLESGVRAAPAAETCAKLAAALGCTLDWLVCGIGQGPEPATVDDVPDTERSPEPEAA